MKTSKFSEVQIIKILSEQKQGKTVNEICQEHGISQPTFYKWKEQIWRFGFSAAHQNEGTGKKLSQYKKVVAEFTMENVE